MKRNKIMKIMKWMVLPLVIACLLSGYYFVTLVKELDLLEPYTFKLAKVNLPPYKETTPVSALLGDVRPV